MQRPAIALFALLVIWGAACVPAPVPPPAAAYFDVDEVVEGLEVPMAVRFSANGSMFVAERKGVVKAFDSIGDTSPTVVADVSAEVSTMWDRGLSGLAVDPGFHSGRPYLYILYSYDAPPGGVAPAWPDGCATEGFGNDGVCGITTGRLERLELNASNVAVGRTTLVHDWCQQFGGHSVGDLQFGPDGSLYAGAGDAANFNAVDWGQFGANPCGDPPFEGGMLRSQDARTTSDPTSPHGAIIRVDPDTGDAWPTNPWAGDADENRARIVGFGFRNPYRFTVDEESAELVVGDVGWSGYEEVNRLALEPDVPVNFGWPCFEGPRRQPAVDSHALPMCESLADSDVAMPDFAYRYDRALTAHCDAGGSSVTGLVTSENSSYPPPFDKGLFLADYARQCIVFFPEVDGEIEYDQAVSLAHGRRAVDLQVGPSGNLFFVDIVRGTVNEVKATGSNQVPSAAIAADPTSGALPLTVNLDASSSVDPDGGPVHYAWDLDDDGNFDDGWADTAIVTFSDSGEYRIRVRVSDPLGASDVASVVISAGNSPPEPIIDMPVEGTYAPGDPVGFSGSASDLEDGDIPASGLSWSFAIHHCPDGETCHVHDLATIEGQASGTFEMPEHESSFLRVTLTATDSLGAVASTARDIQIGEAP